MKNKNYFFFLNGVLGSSQILSSSDDDVLSSAGLNSPSVLNNLLSRSILSSLSSLESSVLFLLQDLGYLVSVEDTSLNQYF